MTALDLPAVADEPTSVAPVFHIEGGRAKAFVDFQNDVTADDVALAAREGYVSVEHLKRYTTLGMATDQGRTANLNGLALLAALTGRTIPETGLTTNRPPTQPVAIGALAGRHRGRHFRPTRLTPTHGLAKELGATTIEIGPWLRAQYFPRPGETDWQQSVDREAAAVRSAVGVTDMSTFGKIEVAGPDALAFLARLYVNDVTRLKVGRCAYGVMLREDGFAFDDGTLARLSGTRFLASCSTAHAAAVYEHMEHASQVLWPDMRVAIESVSDQWAQLALAGPRAREVLARIVDGLDLSNEAFPFMAVREATVMGGVRARLFRISFSGELAYEIAVPADRGADLMRALLEAGEPFGIVPYGTEAVGVLRIEKGHPAGGEFNGQVGAHELGLGGMVERAKARGAEVVGLPLALRPAVTNPERGRLVGLKPVDGQARLRAGAHLLRRGAAAVAANDEGYVTSVAHSPALSSWIGLAYLKDGETRTGEIVRAYDPLRGGDVEVEVVPRAFIDPQGARARG